MMHVIDSHIHLDMYNEQERKIILELLEENRIEGLIAVSNHLESAKATLDLANHWKYVHPAFGFHPEQALPTEKEINNLFAFMKKHSSEMIAVGEVGLPYYLRLEKGNIQLEPYIELLEEFIKLAKEWDKPIVLHAVYGDAAIACSLLEKYSFSKAHFHWFKGDRKTTERMIENGYSISITPDVLYEKEIQELVEQYPITQMMVETDGPWPFEGPFQKQMTHPRMMHESIREIAIIKQMDVIETYKIVYQHTKTFYQLYS